MRKNVLNYKKPALWIIVGALAVCAAAAVCFLTNPKEALSPPEPFGRSYRVESVVYEDLIYSFTYTPDTAPQYNLTADFMLMEKVGENDWSPLGTLQEDHLSPLVFDDYFREADGGVGWRATPFGPEKLRLDNKAAWSLIAGDKLYYVILQNNGDVYLAYGYYDAAAEYPDSQGSIRWLFKLRDAGAEAPPETLALMKNTSYVSQRCIYMNPLSSTLSDGDSGCRYFLGEDSFTIVNQVSGETVSVASPVGWNWQEVGAETWAALFPLEFGRPDISRYGKPLMLKMSDRYYLFNMDGELWIGQYKDDRAGIWSVYSLVPEGSAGANWEYTPLLSSRLPAFPFRFDLAYTSIEAECTGGHLIGYDDHTGSGYPQGEALTVPAGSALYWSPTAADADPTFTMTAQIRFTVYIGDKAVYAGEISIAGTAGTEAVEAIYNAVLSEGYGLSLVQAPDADGALIQASP